MENLSQSWAFFNTELLHVDLVIMSLGKLLTDDKFSFLVLDNNK